MSLFAWWIYRQLRSVAGSLFQINSQVDLTLYCQSKHDNQVNAPNQTQYMDKLVIRFNDIKSNNMITTAEHFTYVHHSEYARCDIIVYVELTLASHTTLGYILCYRQYRLERNDLLLNISQAGGPTLTFLHVVFDCKHLHIPTGHDVTECFRLAANRSIYPTAVTKLQEYIDRLWPGDVISFSRRINSLAALSLTHRVPSFWSLSQNCR